MVDDDTKRTEENGALLNRQPRGDCKRSFWTKQKLMWSCITVEPMVLLIVLAFYMTTLANQNLSLEKACRVSLNFEQEVCNALSSRNTSGYNQTQQAQVQKFVASLYIWRNVAQSIVPLILLPFLGSWSDRHQRRKACITIPVVGKVCSCIMLLFCTYFFYELPIEINVVSECVPIAITGGSHAINVGSYSYVSASSSSETRTVRIGILNTICNIGITVGYALSGVICEAVGFAGVFWLALCLYVSGIVYSMLVLKEKRDAGNIKPGVGFLCDFFDTENFKDALRTVFQRREGKTRMKMAFLIFLQFLITGPTYVYGVWRVKETVAVVKTTARVGFFRDFFNATNIKDAIKLVCKRRKGITRLSIFAVIFIHMLLIGPNNGETSVVYLYTIFKFQWNEVDFSIFQTISCVVNFLGSAVALTIFSKILKWDDAILGIIATISKICSSLLFAFAPSSHIFFIGIMLDIFHGAAIISTRSILTKLVPHDELGKVNSIFGMAEALMSLIYGPLYSALYEFTIDIFPGSFYILGTGLTLPATLIFLWLYTQRIPEAHKEVAHKEVELENYQLNGNHQIKDTCP